MISEVLIVFIRVYQRFISPFKRPCCRFYPTCSEYTIEAIREYGLVSGALLALKRLLKCHPFHPGGYDPLIADDLVRSLEFGVRRKRKHND